MSKRCNHAMMIGGGLGRRITTTRIFNITLFILFSLIGQGRSIVSYDCNKGCDISSTNSNNNDDLVCGDDQNTYANECLAICQNVKVAKTGSCIAITNDDVHTKSSSSKMDQDSSNMESETTIVDIFIPIQVMKQYETLGYKLVRKWDYTKLIGKVRIPSVYIDNTNDGNITSSVLQEARQSSSSSSLYKSRMMTADGYEYVGNDTEAFHMDNNIMSKEGGTRSVDGYDPFPSVATATKSSFDNRTLKVIGSDTRVKIINTTKFPYKVIGALGYSPDNTVCSGTVIYKSAVLTAAHCVYDTDIQQFVSHTYFAPGRGNNGIDWNEPYGRWFVDKINIYSTYKSSSNFGLDIAVITYKPNGNGQSIGDVVGYAGIEEVDGYDDPDLDLSTITGYPGDKGGRTMWTMGVCPNGFISPARYGGSSDNKVVLHDCDITPGTSGSSIMRLSGITDSTTYRVRGVNVFEIRGTPDIPWNGANVFMRGNGLYDAVVYWSGRFVSDSVPPELSFDPASCFSKSNTVEVMNVGAIPIERLRIGDSIKTKNDKYTKVYSFGHLNHNVESIFLQLFFDNNEQNDPLEVSARHFVYVDTNSQQSKNHKMERQHKYRQKQIIIKPAGELVIGDVLSGKTITSIQMVNRFGVYAPLTESGDMMVNNILVSNHVQLVDTSWMLWNQHQLGNILFSPYRVYCGYYLDSCKKETYTKDGYSIYVSWIVRVSIIINRFCGFISWIASFLHIPISIFY